MSTLYLIALCGVCAVFFAIMFETMARVTRKPVWHSYQSVYAAPLHTAPNLVAQVATPKPAIQAIPVMAVDERHSGFVGLTNNEEFQLTA